MHIGQVRYLDYDRERVPETHDLDPFLCKRKSFDFEREVRALWRAGDEAEEEEGRYIRADLGRLLERVVVCPTAEPWFTELVRSVTTRFGLEVPVEDSELIREPEDDAGEPAVSGRDRSGSGPRAGDRSRKDREERSRPRARRGSRRAGSSAARRSP